MNWAVGITTAPRRAPTLDRCLASLQSAGWEACRVFGEPGVDVPMTSLKTSVTLRDTTLGVWSNWLLGLTELFQRQPHADFYMLVQDDALFCKNARRFMERTVLSDVSCAVFSPYCPNDDAKPAAGWHKAVADWRLTGAVTIVFPASSIERFLIHPLIVSYRKHDPRGGVKHIDSVVGQWVQAVGGSFFRFSPSLVQHIGSTSTICASDKASGGRQADSFVGEHFDALSLLSDRQENLFQAVGQAASWVDSAPIVDRRALPEARTPQPPSPSGSDVSDLPVRSGAAAPLVNTSLNEPGLEIGSGDHPLDGFDRLDMLARPGVSHVARWGAERLPIADATYESVFASHVLEHVPWYQTQDALAEVLRVLRPGGVFECWVPDFAYIVRCYQQGICGDSWRRFNQGGDPMRWLNGRIFTYGPGDDNWHRACFDEAYLRKCLIEVGFVDVHRVEERTLGVSHGPIDLGIRARRP